MDIRLESMPYKLGDKEYQLRCNMNVLADVQEVYGGDLVSALTENPMKSVMEFLAAMLNDYADEKGWDERFTAKGLGRMLTMKDLPIDKIMGLVVRAMSPESEESGN